VVSSDNTNLSAGTYTFSVTDSTGCVQQIEYQVMQSSALSAHFTASNDTVYLTEDNEEFIEFTADSKFITSYLWDFGDGSPFSTSPNPSHLFGAGTYTVTLVASDGNCSDTTTQVVVVYSDLSTGLTSVSGQEEVTFINNNSSTDIRFRMNKVSDVTIEVYNSIGQSVQETKRLRIMHNTISCDFSSLPKGIYYIKVSSGDKAPVTKKVVRS
jgi:PKD repeat protein